MTRCLSAAAAAALLALTAAIVSPQPVGQAPPGFVRIPGGSFQMGDHHGFIDPKHESDEIPLHEVRLDAFYIGINDVTTREYCEFLNSALAQKLIAVRDGGVYLSGGGELLCETRGMSPYSRIGWDGKSFAVLDKKENHPMVCLRWPGAAVYGNWLSAQKKLPACYNTGTWECDFNKSGVRLPTEAEWEYAARGGQQQPYWEFPWANQADPTKANWPESKNPYRYGPLPWTTPVGFFDGELHNKADFGWPGPEQSFQTANGANGFGLYDMAGNVWQFVNDWYERDYYTYSPLNNPPGPARGSIMPDGKAYRGMRGGNWYNGEDGHSRVSNRDPSYYRGPQDPNHPYYHVGFRVVLPIDAESRPAIRPTPVPVIVSRAGAQDGNRPGRGGPVLTAQAGAGDARPPRNDQGGGGGRVPGGVRLMPPGAQEQLHLTAEQEKQVADLETETQAKFDKILTPEQQQQLRQMRPAQRPGGNGGGNPNPPAISDDRPARPDVRGSDGNQGGGAGRGAGGGGRVPGGVRLMPPAAQEQLHLTAEQEKQVADLETETQAKFDKILTPEQQQQLRQMRPAQRPGGNDGGNPNPPANSDNRPPRPDGRGSSGNQGGGGGQRGGGGGGRGGGRAEMAENKTPVSPNPGQTVGLFLSTPKAYNGYTLFAPKHNTVTYLIDNQGRVVHQWKSAYEPGQSAYLLPNGHLLRAGMLKVAGGTGGGEGGRIEEYDWDGKMVWEFDCATRDYQLHHDIKPMPNGHILALMVERKSRQQAIQAGFEAGLLRDDYLSPDAVVEIEPIRPKGGRIVWEWRVWDHLIHNAAPAAHPELVDPNLGRGIPAFWNHMNSLDYNPSLDQILLSVRGNSEIWIIDHSTSKTEAAGHNGGKQGKGGDLIYRWGNPAAYQRGSAADQQLIQQHDAEWIPPGYPGAGHLTIFNNGYDRGWSSIEEIVPPMGAGGHYLLASGKSYGPNKPVWHYEAKNRADFFSSEISGAQRLPNGNTLICAGVVGNLFEITPSGETVWQYVNPMVRGGILAQGELPGKDTRGHLWNAVFKIHRYEPDYPGLKGQRLVPGNSIELPASERGKTGLDKLDAGPDDAPGRRGPGGRKGGDRQQPGQPGQGKL